jgi:hypothetical protein
MLLLLLLHACNKGTLLAQAHLTFTQQSATSINDGQNASPATAEHVKQVIMLYQPHLMLCS